MGAGPSGFKTEAARAEFHRLYDEAVAHSSVPIEQTEVQTSFGSTHVLTAGDRNKPPLVAMHGLSMSSTMWIPLLPIPTLVIVPRDETLHDGPTMAQRFREQLPHAQVELVDDANHLVVIDQPNVVNELLATFLSA